MHARPSRAGLDGLRLRTAGLERAMSRIGLPAWFIAVDLIWIAKPAALAIDSRHYQRAANAWLAGGNPWAVMEGVLPYAAGPHTLLFYAPTSWLPVPVATALWFLIGAAAAAWVVRRLGLPLWWVLFPPLMHAAWNGNPQTVMLALLVLGTSAAGALAAMLKLYALLPLVFRPRHLVVAVAVLAVTTLLLPWQIYLESGLGVGTHIALAWNGSAWRVPILLPPTLIALWILRRRGGEWFAVPAVFPATQFYYVSTALPAIANRQIIAAVFATPIVLGVPIVVLILAAQALLEQTRFGRPSHALAEASGG